MPQAAFRQELEQELAVLERRGQPDSKDWDHVFTHTLRLYPWLPACARKLLRHHLCQLHPRTEGIMGNPWNSACLPMAWNINRTKSRKNIIHCHCLWFLQTKHWHTWTCEPFYLRFNLGTWLFASLRAHAFKAEQDSTLPETARDTLPDTVPATESDLELRSVGTPRFIYTIFENWHEFCIYGICCCLLVHASEANAALLKQIVELKAANDKLKGERIERTESTTPSPRVAGPTPKATPSPRAPSVAGSMASMAHSKAGSPSDDDDDEATFFWDIHVLHALIFNFTHESISPQWCLFPGRLLERRSWWMIMDVCVAMVGQWLKQPLTKDFAVGVLKERMVAWSAARKCMTATIIRETMPAWNWSKFSKMLDWTRTFLESKIVQWYSGVHL